MCARICVRKGQPSRTCSLNIYTHTQAMHTQEVFHVKAKDRAGAKITAIAVLSPKCSSFYFLLYPFYPSVCGVSTV